MCIWHSIGTSIIHIMIFILPSYSKQRDIKAPISTNVYIDTDTQRMVRKRENIMDPKTDSERLYNKTKTHTAYTTTHKYIYCRYDLDYVSKI